MRSLNKFLQLLLDLTKDQNFLHGIKLFENSVAKILSLALVGIIIVSIYDLFIYLTSQLFTEPFGFFNITLLEIFGLFLNILIALELLENITAYFKKNIFHAELVIVISLVAVARKIIIFDLNKYSSNDLMALGVAILCLAISYWLIKITNTEHH